jgi:subtilase-type proteinase RRT12
MKILTSLLIASYLTSVNALEFIIQYNKNFNLDSFVSEFFPKASKTSQSLDQIGIKSFEIGKFKGIIGDFTPGMISHLHDDLNVEAISIDRELVLSEVQENAPEHLTRLSQRQKLRKGQSMDYVYDPSGGIGVDVYVLDSGIQLSHQDFTKRVHKIADFTVQGEKTDQQTDPVGHGTYVAGVIGSETNGVAKKANLYDVKVTNSRGRTRLASVIRALNLVVNDSKVTQRPTVVVIPLIMRKSAILNAAVEAVVSEGIPVIVSAGNDGQAACDYSPASAKGSLTVGSLDAQDNIASFSNWGPCVDVFAPGVKVQTTSVNGNGTTTKSGTSLSAGIAAGMVAYYMGMGDTGTQAVERVVKYALTGAISAESLEQRPATTNKILFNGEDDSGWGLGTMIS